MKERCKEKIHKQFHDYRCLRFAVKDGFCKQHHPATVEARKQLSIKNSEEKWKNSQVKKLIDARERIKVLEEMLVKTIKEVDKLKEEKNDN